MLSHLYFLGNFYRFCHPRVTSRFFSRKKPNGFCAPATLIREIKIILSMKQWSVENFLLGGSAAAAETVAEVVTGSNAATATAEAN